MMTQPGTIGSSHANLRGTIWQMRMTGAITQTSTALQRAIKLKIAPFSDPLGHGVR